MRKECTCADCGEQDRSATWRNEAGLILCSHCFREYREWAARESEPVYVDVETEWPDNGAPLSDVHGYL